MTTTGSGRIDNDTLRAVKGISSVPPSERTPKQTSHLNNCLTALAHQPEECQTNQGWGKGGPVAFLEKRGILFTPAEFPEPRARSWYQGCRCREPHWTTTKPISKLVSLLQENEIPVSNYTDKGQICDGETPTTITLQGSTSKAFKAAKISLEEDYPLQSMDNRRYYSYGTPGEPYWVLTF